MSIYFLIGAMGSGKSTTAKELASLFGYSSFDTDSIIEKKYNATITEIFIDKGEEEFRKIESETIKDLIEQPNFENCIVACGGGLVNSNEVLDLIKKKGEVIYLKASEKTLADRVKDNKLERPLIAKIDDDDLPQFFVNLVRERAKFYHQANKVVAIEDLSTQELYELIK